MLSRLGGKPINKQLQSRAISNNIGEKKIHNYNIPIARQRNLRDFDDLVQYHGKKSSLALFISRSTLGDTVIGVTLNIHIVYP